VVVGAIIDFQMFVVAYATDYRGYLVPAAMVLAAAIIGRLMFDRSNWIFQLLLTLPLAIAGFVCAILIAGMLGIPFD